MEQVPVSSYKRPVAEIFNFHYPIFQRIRSHTLFTLKRPQSCDRIHLMGEIDENKNKKQKNKDL
jgi:hypothetical protein